MKIIDINNEIIIRAKCDMCDGYGFVKHTPGPNVPSLNSLITPSSKGSSLSIDKAREVIAKASKIVDNSKQQICGVCGGHGKISHSITLSDLKRALGIT